MRRIKVAIVGGGCGAMTAAYELSRPEHAGRFDITVYQMGWRLGGKGASGRGVAGRVEEHGLHIWLGFYENAFRMMRETYGELAAAGDTRFGDWREAFVPEPSIGLFAPGHDGGWRKWNGRFPPRPGLPGDPAEPGALFSVSTYLGGALAMLATLLMEVEVSRHGPHSSGDPHRPTPPPPHNDVDRLLGTIRSLLDRGVFAGAIVLVEGLTLLRVALAELRVFDGVVLRLAERVSAGVRQWLEDLLIADDRHAHVWEVADLVLAATVGTLRFNLLTDPRGLDSIDDYDCREWLRMNGASERAVNSPFVRGLYDLALAYEDGDAARPGIAAGQGMRGALRMFFGYRGALFWRMRAGMGDVVFAPLYELLKRRGVTFEFFHRLTNVGLAPGGPIAPGERSHVTSLDFEVQADAPGYAPLVNVAGRPCWPSEPLHGVGAPGIDYESHWQRPCVATKRLEVTRDFDFAVLGVSVGAISDVCSEILARDERWRTMTHAVKTVATQAFQVWLTHDLDELGWNGPPYLASAFVKPFDTWCDMAHVVPEEGWTARPATAVYFCGVLKDGPGTPAERTAEVRANAETFMGETARALWPGAYDAEGCFRWDILAAEPPSAATGRERFATQYWRANVNPTDRYVLSLPGSLKHRISPLDMTYDNLTIAGDWTACGLNTGCTEAAVMSGRLAAHALSGLPALADITGYDHP